jgi:hypothetical protein
MISIYAVKKLLNTSRLASVSRVTEHPEEQIMHSWYAGLFSSTFPGKLMVMYVHEPSLLTVVCRGKTIKSTWPQFVQRLQTLLQRYQFSPAFIEREMKEANSFVVAKTESRSMLAYMNQMILQLEYDCSRFNGYDAISLDLLEDGMMDMLHQSKVKSNHFTNPAEYWGVQVIHHSL